MEDAQHRTGADRQAEGRASPRPGAGTEREADVRHRAAEGEGQPATHGGQIRHLFGEDTPLAAGIVAEEAPDTEADDDRATGPGQVPDGAAILRMGALGLAVAEGTLDPFAGRGGHERDRV